MSVELKISYLPDKIYKRSKLEEDLLLQELEKLPSLEEGQVSIDKTYIVKGDEHIEVGFYLRNASYDTLFLGQRYLELVNNEGELLGRQLFNLGKLGDLEPHSAKPGEVLFDKSSVPNLEEITDSVQIRFKKEELESITKVIIDKEPDPLSAEELAQLSQFLRSLPPVCENQISLSPFSIQTNEEGGISANIIVRHGYSKSIVFSRFQIGIVDAQNQIIAKAVFEIPEFTLEPKMFFLRTFTYPPELVFAKNIDLSSWTMLVF